MHSDTRVGRASLLLLSEDLSACQLGVLAGICAFQYGTLPCHKRIFRLWGACMLRAGSLLQWRNLNLLPHHCLFVVMRPV